MNTALWIVQILLALAFLMTGAMKLMQPKEKLVENMAVLNDFSDGQIKGIGVLEILGAIGVILPAWTGILPWLTPVAAVGLILLMLGAAGTHLRREGEMQNVVVNIVLLLLALFVAFGRFTATPLT